MSDRTSLAPMNPVGAISICMNDYGSMASNIPRDLFVDAGIFVALFDEHDDWHGAVNDFWETYIIEPEITPILYTTSDVINEYLHRAVENKIGRRTLSRTKVLEIRDNYASRIGFLFEEGLLQIITLNERVTRESMKRYSANPGYGAKDVFHVTCMKDWGLDFVTVDHVLMKTLEEDADFSGTRTYYPSIDMMEKR